MAPLMDVYGSIHFGFIVLGRCTGSRTGHKTLKHITDLWPTALRDTKDINIVQKEPYLRAYLWLRWFIYAVYSPACATTIFHCSWAI